MKERRSKHLLLFLAGWLLINFLQAYFTELDPDEAYYWLYSKELAWGYFDHPPMVAILIKLGFGLLPNELGVRLFFPIAQITSFVVIWDLLDRPTDQKSLFTLFILMAAMPLLHIYGFVATPDGPLLLFGVLFFWTYRNFLHQNSWMNTVLLGIVMAALLYSKYHGIVLILSVLASNLKLLKNGRFYLASIFGALLFLPHLYWQYWNDFPSFRYHLSGRDDIYELKYTITYLLNQVVVFSPFLFPLIVTTLWKRQFNDLLSRAYGFVIFGFWIFFFWTSFKGHTEPQWTGLLSIPFIILLYERSEQHPNFRKWIWGMGVISILLLFVVRILLIWNFLGIRSDFHNSTWVKPLRAKAEGKPVFFENSYRDASKYAFYSGEKVYAFTNVDYRKSQFDLWNWEQDLQNREAFVIVNQMWECQACELDTMGWRVIRKVKAKNLQVYSKLRINWTPPKMWRLKQKEETSIELEIENNYPFPVKIEASNFPLEISVFFLDQGALFAAQKLSLRPEVGTLEPGLNQLTGRFVVPDSLQTQYEYQMGFGFNYDGLPPSVSSDLCRIRIE